MRLVLHLSLEVPSPIQQQQHNAGVASSDVILITRFINMSSTVQSYCGAQI
jgi:hypothetical protein